MLNTLLSLNADLGSSIALRYALALSSQIEMRIHGIHVVDPARLDAAPGSGWVRKTWENTLIETEKEDILRFLDVEKVDLPFLKFPKVVIGERTDKVLDELRTGEYGLFLEGVPPTTNPADFHKLVNSRLYRMIPCPVLVVKNLLTPTSAAVLLDDHTDLKGLLTSLAGIFNNGKIAFDPIFPKFSSSNTLGVREASVDSGIHASGQAKTLEGSPKAIAEGLRDYGMVVARIDHISKQNDVMLELLGRVPSPVLICRQ